MGKARVWVLRPAGWNMTFWGSEPSALTQWESEQPEKSVPALIGTHMLLGAQITFTQGWCLRVQPKP